MFGNGLTGSNFRGWYRFEECGDFTEGGEGGWSVGSLGGHILVGNTTVTNGAGGSTDGREGSFGGEVESIIGEGVGEGVFLVWMPGTWGQPMFTGGHFFSISATGVVGGC